MKTDSLKVIDRDAVITALRREVEAAGGKRITLRKFLSATGFSNDDFLRNFARWEDVYKEAGYNFRRHNEFIEETLLLEDWGSVTRTLQRPATKTDYGIKGKYSVTTLEARFGGWRGVYSAFQEFAKGKPQWADIKALPFPRSRRNERYRAISTKAVSTAAGKRSKRRCLPGQPWGRRVFKHPLYGARLVSGILQHAPVNENGVLLLFGVMAERLGFLIETVQTGFPDCEAKRLVGPDLWERVRIEFEYESRNFRLHRHDPKGCDIIVCWSHNWPDCPKELEVIALKEELDLHLFRFTNSLAVLADNDRNQTE